MSYSSVLTDTTTFCGTNERTGTCGNYNVLLVSAYASEGIVLYYYDASTGALVAVVERGGAAGCVGGTSDFVEPSNCDPETALPTHVCSDGEGGAEDD
ncbi:MAG: hypothetical protein ABSE49_10085 [Polyangiaceae bacterium]|jgi:hypothetical protein